MKIPQYITIDEVKRVCKELKLRDWAKMKDAKVPASEAGVVLKAVNVEKMPVPLEAFLLPRSTYIWLRHVRCPCKKPQPRAS